MLEMATWDTLKREVGADGLVRMNHLYSALWAMAGHTWRCPCAPPHERKTVLVHGATVTMTFVHAPQAVPLLSPSAGY
jgi:hypothetical protein